jgi:hypothetical protein
MQPRWQYQRLHLTHTAKRYATTCPSSNMTAQPSQPSPAASRALSKLGGHLTELASSTNAYLLAPLNASDVAAFEASKTYVFPEAPNHRGDPAMPPSMITLIGQRNALLYYGQKVQAALEETVHQLSYFKAETQRCHALIRSQRNVIPEAHNPVFPTLATHARATVAAAPAVAEYLAYCHVPLSTTGAGGARRSRRP